MAKKIRWTTRSIIDRTEIYKHWLKRNQSNVYPNIGTRTNYRNVYSKVVRNYKVFYRIETDEIQILRVWDTRQHPDSTGL